MVHKMQFSEDCVFNNDAKARSKPRQQKENQGSINGKEEKIFIDHGTLKTEHTVLLCADVKRIAINSKPRLLYVVALE